MVKKKTFIFSIIGILIVGTILSLLLVPQLQQTIFGVKPQYNIGSVLEFDAIPSTPEVVSCLVTLKVTDTEGIITTSTKSTKLGATNNNPITCKNRPCATFKFGLNQEGRWNLRATYSCDDTVDTRSFIVVVPNVCDNIGFTDDFCERDIIHSCNPEGTEFEQFDCASVGMDCGRSPEFGWNTCIDNVCNSHTNKKCFGGDVYWYNDCSEREDKFDDCNSNEVCRDSRCLALCTTGDSKNEKCQADDLVYQSCINGAWTDKVDIGSEECKTPEKEIVLPDEEETTEEETTTTEEETTEEETTTGEVQPSPPAEEVDFGKHFKKFGALYVIILLVVIVVVALIWQNMKRKK